MTDRRPAAPPAFPQMGVSRAGAALRDDQLPAAPETAPMTPERAAELMEPGTAEATAAPEAPTAPPPPILLLDDDFFGAMTLADAMVPLGLGEVRTATSPQKAEALIDEARPGLAVVALGVGPEAAQVVAVLVALSVPVLFVGAAGACPALTDPNPDAPVLSRDPAALAGAARAALGG